MANTNLPNGTTCITWNGFVQLKATDKTQIVETGEAQKATTAWNTLTDWMRIFYEKAKMALKNTSQLREKL